MVGSFRSRWSIELVVVRQLLFYQSYSALFADHIVYQVSCQYSPPSVKVRQSYSTSGQGVDSPNIYTTDGYMTGNVFKDYEFGSKEGDARLYPTVL
ncbi:hypothetical protein EVAR_34574_1 [Eumeta japonica]|uniref:Uncharacterized protein n=1 Tax=Eumeta variegata TaxID=151549 RepID=A0A4C1Z5R7_EUMVA|nr:hypothetical protein EVAR_34574_1 [Eumeta japonica]